MKGLIQVHAKLHKQIFTKYHTNLYNTTIQTNHKENTHLYNHASGNLSILLDTSKKKYIA